MNTFDHNKIRNYQSVIGLSKRNGVTFLIYYFPIISRTLGATKFVQAPSDAVRHALFML